MEAPQQWKKIKEIVGAALEREPAEREPFLEEACAHDDSLRADGGKRIGANESLEVLADA